MIPFGMLIGFVLLLIDLNVSFEISRLVYVLAGGLSIFITANRKKKAIKELCIVDGLVKVDFEHLMKSPERFGINEVTVVLRIDELHFVKKTTPDLIGVAYKKRLESEEDWDLLMEQFANIIVSNRPKKWTDYFKV